MKKNRWLPWVLSLVLLCGASFGAYQFGYDEGKKSGYDTGFNDGHTDGHTAGYDEGLRSGKASGHAEGYQEGYNDGKSDGYDSGYQDGKNISRYSSTSASGETVTLTLSRTVYVTDTGSKYHRSGCSYLNRSKHPISLTDAQNQGYSPCSRCDPPS